MRNKCQNKGFSLTEVLLAVGTLAIGMVFISGTFLTGIHFSTIATERTIAVVVADEAFAKMRLYGVDSRHFPWLGDPTSGIPVSCRLYEDVVTIPSEEYLYPSTRGASERQYSWSALFPNDYFSGSPQSGFFFVPCTVFICRQTGASQYWRRERGGTLVASDRPRPVRVRIRKDDAHAVTNEVVVEDYLPGDAIDERAFVQEGCILVDDDYGEIFRVMECDPDQVGLIRLDRPLIIATSPGLVRFSMWVVPPSVSGGRVPVTGVYQRVLRLGVH